MIYIISNVTLCQDSCFLGCCGASEIRRDLRSSADGRCGRMVAHFHEKAGLVNLFFLAVPAKYPTTDQREAHYLASFPLVHNRRIAPLPSALFMEQSAPVPVGVLNLNGCCHLGTELNRLCFQKLPFLADAAVTRTRRSATDCNSSDYAATFFRSCWSLKFRSGSYTSPVTHNR